jgi:hypothetical protein
VFAGLQAAAIKARKLCCTLVDTLGREIMVRRQVRVRSLQHYTQLLVLVVASHMQCNVLHYEIVLWDFDWQMTYSLKQLLVGGKPE